MVAAGAHGRCG